uniref:Uncharacterized protein n=1 Tax=Cyclophora tenuis TaxID=216820 RepID=A0A7S1CUP5_CYCTE
MHDQLVALDEDEAQQQVFSPRTRLKQHIVNDDKLMLKSSSGDGAWIMQKCAKTLGGGCKILFETHQTVFSLTCRAEVLSTRLAVSTGPAEFKKFRLPETVWGIAIDDSSIQRKLLNRFLTLAGVNTYKRRVLGQNPDEIMGFTEYLVDLVRRNKDDKFLVIVDENLDIVDEGTTRQTVLGSLCIQAALREMSAEEERRVLALVRSANDSKEDVELYLERAHGFMPKAPIQKHMVLHILEPYWKDRFPSEVTAISSSHQPDIGEDHTVVLDDSFAVTGNDLIVALDIIDDIIARETKKEEISKNWPRIREKLHSLKGDLKSMESSSRLRPVVDAIERLRGETVPEELVERWRLIRTLIISML